MQQPSQKRLHPVLWVAAVSVTVFSLVGVGAITGVIPSGNARDKAAETAVGLPAASGLTVPGLPQTAASPQVALHTQPAAEAPAKASGEAPAAAHKPAPKPVTQAPKPRPAVAEAPAPSYTAAPAARVAAPVPPPAPVARVCNECGVIESVYESEQRGEGSGLGAVAGGVVGGLLGHQVGGGRGKDIATVVGAVAGGVAGNNMERNMKKTPRWEVTVRFNDGTSRSFTQATPPAWRMGDKVKVVNGMITGA